MNRLASSADKALNIYVNFLYEIKTQPVFYTTRSVSHFAKTGCRHHKFIDLATGGGIMIQQPLQPLSNDRMAFDKGLRHAGYTIRTQASFGLLRPALSYGFCVVPHTAV